MMSSILVSASKFVIPDKSSRNFALLAAFKNMENFSLAKVDTTTSLQAVQCENKGVVGKN